MVCKFSPLPGSCVPDGSCPHVAMGTGDRPGGSSAVEGWPSNNAFERSVRRRRVRAASAARHHALPARSRAHRAAAQRER